MVRVTFDLDEDLARAVQARAVAHAVSFHEALRDLVHRALRTDAPRSAEAPLFHVIQDLVKEAARGRSSLHS
jgi:plasmid stability protein